MFSSFSPAFCLPRPPAREDFRSSQAKAGHLEPQARLDRELLEVRLIPRDYSVVSKLEQIEAELEKLSRPELIQIRNWLDDLLEDELEFTPEFEAVIQKSEREMAAGHILVK
jgi:hypothetical protein